MQIFLRLCDKHPYKLFDKSQYIIYLAAQIHPKVERDLVVSASCGMQLFAKISKPLGEHLLYKHMDIFGAHIKLQLAACQIVVYICKLFGNDLAVFFVDYPLLSQHIHVDYAALDIVLVHTAVKRY